MARARNIKPGTFKNEVLGVADPIYTLLFEGLWLLADRAGRLEDRPLKIKGEIFPYRDGLNVDALLSWLEAAKFIERYEADGKRYIWVVEFDKHQKPHKNEPASEIPPAPSTIAASKPEAVGSKPEEIGSARADSGLLKADSGLLKADGASPDAARADDSGSASLPSMAGAVCITLRAKGVQSVNPSHPDLVALLEAGTDIGSFAAAAEKAVKAGKGSFAYVLAVVKGQAADSQRIAANARASPLPQSRKDRQLETAALLTGASRPPQAKPLETIDVESRILPA